MADLPTNFLDDILSASMGGKRRYKITRLDGSSEEVTIEDISKYDQVGSTFGAGDINKTNQAVNEKFDSGDVVDPMLTTEPGFAADAYRTKLQFDEQNENITALGESVSSGKTLVANAITAKGVSTSTSATFSTMATNIGKISSIKGVPLVGTVGSDYNISGLTVGNSYLLHVANIHATKAPAISSGGTVIGETSKMSPDKYNGYYTVISSILFNATSSTIKLSNIESYKRVAYTLIEL